MKIKKFNEFKKINEAVNSDNKTYISLKELKDFLNTIPEEMNEYELVFREYSQVEVDNENMSVALDKPILAFYVDDKTKEFAFMDEKSLEEYDKLNID